MTDAQRALATQVRSRGYTVETAEPPSGLFALAYRTFGHVEVRLLSTTIDELAPVAERVANELGASPTPPAPSLDRFAAILGQLKEPLEPAEAAQVRAALYAMYAQHAEDAARLDYAETMLRGGDLLCEQHEHRSCLHVGLPDNATFDSDASLRDLLDLGRNLPV